MQIPIPLLATFTFWDVFRSLLDIACVSVLFYYLFQLIRGTRAVQIIQGVGVLLLILLISFILKLETIYWILRYFLYAIAVALPIVFQPELRRALQQIGRGGVIHGALSRLGREDIEALVNELALAVNILSQTRNGALIAMERETGLEEYIETGTVINGDVSTRILLTIFWMHAPLHDGAVILRGNKIVAAGCHLPLSDHVPLGLDHHLGTRHLAALGLAEQTDSMVVVVSEETGDISVAHEGTLARRLNDDQLRTALMNFCTEPVTAVRPPSWIPRWRFINEYEHTAKKPRS